ncbi:MAG: RluA family pseudouridine synthase [Lachnospiraceae bacterium]|nr:RluA family pseudouridine synthase [Lachnospiraceae bacterium]
MTVITIDEDYAGIRFDKYLRKHFPGASSGFLYKMLRKKNIVLNGKKATGSETLKNADEIKVFFSEETYQKMRQSDDGASNFLRLAAIRTVPDIIFEDENILLLNKPAGILSQKAKPEDISLNETALSYLIHKGELSEEQMRSFRPSVMNRLDRNTSGITAFAKTYEGARYLADGLKSHSIKKEYAALVIGECGLSGQLHGYIKKDPASNLSKIVDASEGGAKAVAMEIMGSVRYDGYTLLSIELLSGRSHQIRAWLSALGYPIAGDVKYGKAENAAGRRGKQGNGRSYKQGNAQLKGTNVRGIPVTRQLLHARRLCFPDGRVFTADYPDDFARVITALENR